MSDDLPEYEYLLKCVWVGSIIKQAIATASLKKSERKNTMEGAEYGRQN